MTGEEQTHLFGQLLVDIKGCPKCGFPMDVSLVHNETGEVIVTFYKCRKCHPEFDKGYFQRIKGSVADAAYKTISPPEGA